MSNQHNVVCNMNGVCNMNELFAGQSLIDLKGGKKPNYIKLVAITSLFCFCCDSQ